MQQLIPIIKCEYCDREHTRYHARHDNGKLEHLCEKHYAVWHPALSKWKPDRTQLNNNEMKKWKEYFIMGDKRTHFIITEKGARLWYTKFGKRVHVDFDLHPTSFQLTDEGRKAFWQLYAEVANKKSYAFLSPLSSHMKIPKEQLEHVITKLMKILSANIEDDPELKKFEEEFGIEPKTVSS